MKSLLLKGQILASIFSLLLISCGGGGGGMSAGGGIDGTGIMSAGVVSAFGSIIVNGLEFDTSQAVIIVNGREIGTGDDVVRENLEIGMVVNVEGRIKKDGSAVADRVIYRADVIGPVESVNDIDATTKELVVLGQIVVVNVVTNIRDTSFDAIAEDDLVKVSGYLDFDGKIRATFIEKTGVFASGDVVEVTGFIKSLDFAAETFEINGLTVSYASISSELPEGIPDDNLFVEVEGTLDAPGGDMIATAIELADVLDGEDGDEFEIMGFVTEIISDDDIIEFKVGNQVVSIDPDAVVFVDGNADDIVPGAKLEAEGSFENGILFADEIEFWDLDQTEVEGFVTEVVSETEFKIGNQDILTDSETVFEPPELEVAEGRRIEVKGVPADIDYSVIIADKVSLEVD